MLTIAAPGVDKIPLVGRGTNTASIAAQSRTAALGLALVVLEDEQIVGAHFHGRAGQRHIRLRTAEALRRRRQTRRRIHTIIHPDGGRRKRRATRRCQKILELLHLLGARGREGRREPLTGALGPVRHTQQHGQVRQEQED